MKTQAKPSARQVAVTTVTLSFLAAACGGMGKNSSSNPSGVRISGLISSVTGGCPNMRFKLGSKGVVTNPNSAFPDGNCSDLRNGTAIEVEGGWQSDGSVLARKVRHQPGPRQVHLVGGVSALRGSCPDLRFLLRAEHIVTNANTRFDGVACSSIRNGLLITVRGVRQADGTVLVREVEPEVEAEEIEILGTLTALDGSCPNVTFSLGSELIATSADTRFKKLPCGGLRNGQFVQVEGFRQADGRILAREVEPEIEVREVEIRDVIRNLDGSCPHLTFFLGNSRIVTDAHTRFKEVACSGLSNGRLVEVEGIRQADGSILANEIEPRETE